MENEKNYLNGNPWCKLLKLEKVGSGVARVRERRTCAENNSSCPTMEDFVLQGALKELEQKEFQGNVTIEKWRNPCTHIAHSLRT